MKKEVLYENIEIQEQIDFLLNKKKTLKNLILSLDEMIEIIKEYQDIKKNKDYKTNILKEIRTIYFPIYKAFRNKLKFVTQNFDNTFFSGIYGINFIKFFKNLESYVIYAKNYTSIKICLIDEQIEEKIEKLMEIDHYIFPDIFYSPKNNEHHQKERRKSQELREKAYEK